MTIHMIRMPKGEPFVLDKETQRTAVKLFHSRKERFRGSIKPGMMAGRSAQFDVQHGSKRQGNESGYQHSTGHDNAEFTEKPPGESLQEDHGNEDDGQCQ